MIVQLPYPPKELNPNHRIHWAKKAKITKSYKRECGYQCVLQGVGGINTETVRVTVRFYPPDNRKRDLDNVIAASKAAFDAVALHIGVDDAKW
ncbi:MAG: RusA family crossover junction endodeoxyribonuclease, partial [Nitrospinaceae bacterium]|nr:RusA family crossover junction endodeoxyribonuclease [Nitrospinaceae bacterium]